MNLISKQLVDNEFTAFLRGLYDVLPHNAWIAGGAALALARQIPLTHGFLANGSDIDIFLHKSLDINDIVNKLQKHYSISNAKYRYDRKVSEMTIKGHTVQVINADKYDSIIKLFDDFDFTVCQFATDGSSVYGTQVAWDDMATKTLRVIGPNRKSLGRSVKYCLMGFTPAPQQFAEIVNGALTEEVFDADRLRIYCKQSDDY